jgi:hypothetical protein
MTRSNIIFGALCFAFILYITLRGELPNYLAPFSGGGTSKPASATNSASATTNKSSNASTDTALTPFSLFNAGKAAGAEAPQSMSDFLSNIGLGGKLGF